MIIANCDQGSPEWLKLRVGRLTGSNVHRLFTKAKRDTYFWDLVTERITNQATETHVTPEMEWGREYENVAREMYVMDHEIEIQQVGFIYEGWFGCSPDGLIGHDSGIEIKCPKTKTHLRWMSDGVLPKEHVYQVVTCMLLTGRPKWVFRSFDPRLPPELQAWDLEVRLDDYHDAAEAILVESKVFLDEVQNMVDHLMEIAR